MISKIFRYETQFNSIDYSPEEIISKIISFYKLSNMELVFLHKFNIGTVDFAYKVRLNSREYFLKAVWGSEMLQERMKIEHSVMKSLYGQKLELRYNEITDIPYACFLVLELLENYDNIIHIKQIQNLILEFKYNVDVINILKNTKYDYNYIFEKSVQALDCLSNFNYITTKTKCKITSLLSKNYYKSHCEYVCHGDLSNNNILLHNNKLLLIDWEDAILAHENYDITYWLTFISQRKLLKVETLKKYNLLNKGSYQTFLVIILLKEYLSYINNTIDNNAIGTQERLYQIISLYEDKNIN